MEAEKNPSMVPKPKFCVYENPAFSAALTAKSLQPSKPTLLCIFSACTASAVSLLTIIFKEDGFMENLKWIHVSPSTAYLLAKVSQIVVGLVFMGALSALFRAISLQKGRNAGVHLCSGSPSKSTKEQNHLTVRQQELLGLRAKLVEQFESRSPGSTSGKQKPPKSRPHFGSPPSDILVPIHQSNSGKKTSRIGIDKQSPSGGKAISHTPLSGRSISPGSPLYLVALSPSQATFQSSPGLDQHISTPWSKQRSNAGKEIRTEATLEQFLADVDEKIMESTGKVAPPNQSLMTPPASLHGFGITSPSPLTNSTTNSGTTRSTPLRPVRMSPGSQKYNTPPKKGEGELPLPMSMEQSIEAFENLGIYPHIEQWRDRLRQWFSSVLLNPLLTKIETSHIQVMQTAAKLGISITVNQVGSDLLNGAAPTSLSPIDGNKEWQPTFMLDEDGLLHQLRAALVQARDGSASQFPSAGMQHLQQNPFVPAIQECIDAITEHQRLHALMKGEWVKGLLPQSSVRADYTVQRIQELAEGTCLKNYEYLGNGEVYDKRNKRWTLELPTDSHLLLYLFCAFMEHPKWMLHVDPTSYASTQSGKTPLLLGILPPKERFPEKYVAVLSSIPSVLHPGACILVVGKQSPPIFALYWDKKLQFSLQGRTALWDAVLLLCHRIKLGYGGIVQEMNLGSSAFGLLPILDMDTED